MQKKRNLDSGDIVFKVFQKIELPLDNILLKGTIQLNLHMYFSGSFHYFNLVKKFCTKLKDVFEKVFCYRGIADSSCGWSGTYCLK